MSESKSVPSAEVRTEDDDDIRWLREELERSNNYRTMRKLSRIIERLKSLPSATLRTNDAEDLIDRCIARCKGQFVNPTDRRSEDFEDGFSAALSACEMTLLRLKGEVSASDRTG